MFAVPKTRPPYPEEFRRDAVGLVRAGRSIREVADSLGVSHSRCATGSARTSSIAVSATMG
jgi:transposase